MSERLTSTRPLAYGLGLGLAVVVGTVPFLPGLASLHTAGPIVDGHADVSCTDCHTQAPGSTRQQLQANARFLLGIREQGADFVHAAIRNEDCQSCHDNEGDQHPPYRFTEPRFADVRAELGPTRCVSCHVEHTGQLARVSPTMCQHCHEDIDVINDPVEPSHATLAQDAAWDSCMRCHDYHGNHMQETPTRLDAAATTVAVQDYLAGGDSPYGKNLRYHARSTRADAEPGGTP